MAISHLVKELNINYEETFAERTRLLNFSKNKAVEDELEKGIERVKKDPEKLLAKDKESSGILGAISAAIGVVVKLVRKMISFIIRTMKAIAKYAKMLYKLGKAMWNSCWKGSLKKTAKRTKTMSGKLKSFAGKGAIIAGIAAVVGGLVYSIVSNKSPKEEEPEEEEKEEPEAPPTPAEPAAAPPVIPAVPAAASAPAVPAAAPAPPAAAPPAPPAAAPLAPPAVPAAASPAAAARPVPAASPQIGAPARSEPTKQDEKQGEPVSEMPKNVRISYPSDPVAKSEMMSRVDKELLNRFYGFAKELGSPVSLNSAYRSDNYQAKLWVRGWILKEPGIFIPSNPQDNQHVELGGKEYDVKGGGKGSTHLTGMGLDISAAGITGIKALTDSDKLLNKYGLHRPFYSVDPPHIEMIKGSRAPIGDTDVSKNGKALAQKTSADNKTEKTIIVPIEVNKTQNNVIPRDKKAA